MKEMKQYFVSWDGNLSSFLKGYIYDEENSLNPCRLVFHELKSFILRWVNGEFDEKIVLLPGIRGVGKTTLLAQIYFLSNYLKQAKEFKLFNEIKNKTYVSADNLFFRNSDLNEFLNFYEEYIGASVENLKEKTLILIDEIHYDKKWALFLKLLYDRTKGHKNILVIATGSSALLLRASPDLARRAITKKVLPLNFTEFLMLKYRKFQKKPPRIFQKIFYSRSAKEVFSFLRKKEIEFVKFVSQLPARPEVILNNYFEFGSFPFNIKTGNRTLAFEKVKTVVDKVVEKDILELSSFDAETIAKIPIILSLVADSDQVKLTNVSASASIHIDTLRKLLQTLVKSELLMKIPSYTRTYKQVKKPMKYLFLAPSIRAAILNGILPAKLKGKMLEDYSSLLFAKDFGSDNPRIYYDSSKGGADFILKFKNGRKIIIEVGFSKEDISQIKFTAKKVSPDYSILVGSKSLEIVDNSIVKIPLMYWMLM
ncbi:MAG: ATP-binding protein [Elusimicrobia bacterium]|nr:ATP-binding protein [Elusimicrobiota bacterium]